MSDCDNLSDNISDYDDYDPAIGGDEDDEVAPPIDKVKPVPIDDSDGEEIEDEVEDEIEIEIEEEIEEEEPVDLKSVSNYNKEIIIVKPENCRTSDILSKYEMTELVSIRATQISQFNNCMVDTTGLDDPIKQAQRELMLRMTPLTLRRHVGDVRNKTTKEMESFYEMRDPNTMVYSVTYSDVL